MPRIEQKVYEFSIELGSGPFTSPRMSNKYSNAYLSIEYYDADPLDPDSGASIVQPTAGTMTVTATESNDSSNGYYGSVTNGAMDATSATYSRPNWAGQCIFVKLTETVGVTGNSATHALVKILRT